MAAPSASVVFNTPGANGGVAVPEYNLLTSGTRGLQHRLEQLRSQRRRRVAAERGGRLAAHAARRSRTGDAARRLLRCLRASGHGRVRRRLRRQSGRDASASPATPRPASSDPAKRGRSCCATRAVSTTPRSRPRLSIRLPARANRADDLAAFAPDSRDRIGAQLDGELPAIADEGHGGRHPLRRHARRQSVVDDQLQQRPEPRENGFIDEFRLAMAQPAGEQRGWRQPHRVVRVFRSGNRHQPLADLSRVPQRPALVSRR